MPYVKCNHSIVPEDEQVVWRYMNLSKFISILEDQTLYFPSLKKLSNSDKFEGLYPNFNVQDYPGFQLFENQIDKLRDSARASRSYYYVNCWHMNNSESMAMWKVYSGSGDSIAIKTNFQCLKDALIYAEQKIYACQVGYSNIYIGNNNFLATTKRTVFDYESELRLIYKNIPCNSEEQLDDTLEPTQEGHYIKIDVSKLLEKGEIFISPISGSWFKGLIEKLMSRYGLPKNIVTMSVLTEEPM